MTIIILAKIFVLIVVGFSFFMATAKNSLADGFSPPVNANMGCTQMGEPFLFNGSSASCGFMDYSSLTGPPTDLSQFTNGPGYVGNSAFIPYLTSSTAASVYATQSALASGIAIKLTTPTGTNIQFLNGIGTPTNWANADWSSSSGSSQIFNKPTIPVVQSYEGTVQRLNPILINKTAAVAGGAGNAVFNMTSDGTSSGAALCPNGVMLNSPNLSVNDASAPYQFSWAWTNSNKTMTVLAEKASGIAVLTFTLLGIPAPVPNGTNVNSTVICY